jgi:predicted enzyme related to lactoylglutathione lyase
MQDNRPRFLGTELYFDDLERAKRFYRHTLGLELSEEMPGHHAKFDFAAEFLCLEKKGSESYPSLDKAVIFFEVSDLAAFIRKIGRGHFVQVEPQASSERPAWAVLHDPEGHNVLFIEKLSNPGAVPP